MLMDGWLKRGAINYPDGLLFGDFRGMRRIPAP